MFVTSSLLVSYLRVLVVVSCKCSLVVGSAPFEGSVKLAKLWIACLFGMVFVCCVVCGALAGWGACA
jgi:hypothetical protein